MSELDYALTERVMELRHREEVIRWEAIASAERLGAAKRALDQARWRCAREHTRFPRLSDERSPLSRVQRINSLTREVARAEANYDIELSQHGHLRKHHEDASDELAKALSMMAHPQAQPGGDSYSEPAQAIVVSEPETHLVRLHRTAVSAFDRAALLLPKRVADEQLGDALEDIDRRIAAGCPVWHVWVRIMVAIFWAFIAAWKRAGESKAGAK